MYICMCVVVVYQLTTQILYHTIILNAREKQKIFYENVFTVCDILKWGGVV